MVMKTNVFFLLMVLMLGVSGYPQKLKKADLPASFRPKTTLHVLDSIVWWMHDGNAYLTEAKEVISGRVTGAEYLWSEKLYFYIDTNINSLRLMKKTMQTYLNNSVDAPVEKNVEFPWNTALSAWDDTMKFVHFTGDTNYILDFVVYTDYFNKSYDYSLNKFTDGERHKITLLNDTCPSASEMFLFDTINNVFVPYAKVEITYDSNFLIDTVYMFSYNVTLQQYVLSSRSIYTFSGTLISEIIDQYWDGTQWSNSSRQIYTYDSNGNEIENVFQYWDDIANDWIYSYKREQTFNSSNLLLSEAYFLWDNVQNLWIPTSRTNFDYDSNGNVILREYLYSDGITLVPIQKYEYTYDVNNNVTNVTVSFWDSNISAYYYSYKQDYYYTASRLDSILFYSYDIFSLTWFLGGKTEFEYDSLQALIREEYFGFNGNFEPYSKKQYFYSNINLVVHPNPMYNLISIYPNPANQYLNIHFNRLTEVDAVKIYDTNGRLLRQFNKLSILAPINISDLSTGTYILHVIAGDNVYQSKFTKN